jgi:threonine/homoserine/homoserine lactone efflux protein
VRSHSLEQSPDGQGSRHFRSFGSATVPRRSATRLGVPFGFATMLIAGSVGVAALLLTYPAALIKWAGIAYLLFIAWQLTQPHPHATRKGLDPTGFKPLSFWQSAAFQYANPKAWMLAAATAGSFMASNATVASIAIIVIVFSIDAIGSLVTWAWVGAALRNWLGIGSRMRTFNVAMGTLRMASVEPAVIRLLADGRPGCDVILFGKSFVYTIRMQPALARSSLYALPLDSKLGGPGVELYRHEFRESDFVGGILATILRHEGVTFMTLEECEEYLRRQGVEC